jgi:hypothetical protein
MQDNLKPVFQLSDTNDEFPNTVLVGGLVYLPKID